MVGWYGRNWSRDLHTGRFVDYQARAFEAYFGLFPEPFLHWKRTGPDVFLSRRAVIDYGQIESRVLAASVGKSELFADLSPWLRDVMSPRLELWELMRALRGREEEEDPGFGNARLNELLNHWRGDTKPFDPEGSWTLTN